MKIIIFAILSLCICQIYAHSGQDKNSSFDLKNIEKLNPITIEANKNESNWLKYPASVSVLDEDRLKSNTNIFELIGEVPGVKMTLFNGRQFGGDFEIRGFGYKGQERVIVKQDGVLRSVSFAYNPVSSFRSDNDILKRIEVIKGASSVLHGSGAIGGIVSMKTKNAKDFLENGDNLGFMLGQRFETNNMQSTRAAAYVKLDKLPLDILLYGKTAKFKDIKLANGGIDGRKKAYNDENIKTIMLKVGADLTDEQRLELSFFNYDEKLDTLKNKLHKDSDSYPPLLGKIKQRDFIIDYNYSPENISWIDLHINAYQSKANSNRQMQSYDQINKKFISKNYINENKRLGIEVKNIAKFKTYDISHNLVTGLQYNNKKENFKESLKFPNGIYEDYAAYAQDIMEFGLLEFTLGARLDSFDRNVKNKGKKYSSKKLSPHIGVSYEIFKSINLLASYSESFRAPSPHESSIEGNLAHPLFWYLPNPNLEAEKAKEYELGVSHESYNLIAKNDIFNFKFIYFSGNIKDMIIAKALTSMGVPPQGKTYFQYQNLDNVTRNGYEISLNYMLYNIIFGASYEHIKLHDKKSKENIGFFADRLHTHIAYNTTENFNMELSLNHWFKPKNEPKFVKNFLGTFYYVEDSFTIADFRGNYNLKNKISFLKNLNIGFGVNNIFDKKYISAGQFSNTKRVGKGRNFYIDCELKF